MSEWLVYTLSILLFLDIGLLLVLILGLNSSVPEQAVDFPDLSILVSARNEQENLPSCLDSLLNLEYPGNIEFLIGNDASTDQTASVIHSYSEKDNRLRYIPIEPGPTNLNGKANALSQLAGKAKGEVILFTDADMKLNPKWATHMVSQLKKKYRMTSGVTSIEGRKIFMRCQNQDWLFAQGMLRVISNVLGTATALGNNMGLYTNSYRELGGFESLEFTLTEDHELNKAFRKAGLKTGQEMHPDALGFSKPEPGISAWLNQRKRWMTGALKLPGWLIFLLTVHNLRWILLSIFLFIKPWLTLIGLLMLMLDLIFLGRISSILRLKFDLAGILAFQIYQGILYPLSVLYFFLPFSLTWKDRKYK